MEFPDDILGVIREFSRPCCRLDWKQGSYIVQHYTSPESNFHADLIMKVHDWREDNYYFDEIILSYEQLYEQQPIWENTYHAYFYQL